jgi:3-deoxy-manno-octulosonate cytidylyltransferase (CMP-KDO synthetase)
MSIKSTIVIPARYASTRLPGKPLVKIAGKTMLNRVAEIASKAAEGLNVEVIAAIDDKRIEEHCQEIGLKSVMTDPDCPSGTDRVAEAIRKGGNKPDFVLNLQGDAPLTPPEFIRALIDSFSKAPCDVVTPVTQLSWNELDELRKNKQVTPFSGTCAAFDEATGNAFWFSKNIIPAIRKEEELRKASDKSPVYKHIGLYGYSYDMLMSYSKLKESRYEKLEGLEQLRVLENGYKIRCVPVQSNGRGSVTGVDSPEDVKRAEAFIAKHGEL